MGSHECVTPDLSSRPTFSIASLLMSRPTVSSRPDRFVTPDVIGRLHCKEGYPVVAGHDLVVTVYDGMRGFRFSKKGALSLLNFHRLRQAQEVVVGPDFHFARIAQEGEYILFDP